MQPRSTTQTTPAYYITATHGPKRVELAGPFRTWNEAESELELVQEEACARWPEQSAPATFGVELVYDHYHRRGTLNRAMHYRQNLSGWIV